MFNYPENPFKMTCQRCGHEIIYIPADAMYKHSFPPDREDCICVAAGELCGE